MNRMHQILLGLLFSILASTCLASEKKPFYEVLHNPEYTFHIEDYHADMVLGMLPYIKTSIKDFRKRNFTRHDIENMYQTLTIFWPVVRKYLHLKEELVDSNSSEEHRHYYKNTSFLSSSENNQILYKKDEELSRAKNEVKIGQDENSHLASLVLKIDKSISPKIELSEAGTTEKQEAFLNPKTDYTTSSPSKQDDRKATNIDFDDVQTRLKLGQRHFSQPAPFVYKKDHQISPILELNRTSIYTNQDPFSNPSLKEQGSNRRKYTARFSSLRESLPLRQDIQKSIDNQASSTSTRNNQKNNTINLVKMKGIRESSSVNNARIKDKNKFQPARTSATTNKRINQFPFRSISNRTSSNGNLSNFVGSIPIPTTQKTPEIITSDVPFSYTTRRPYKRMLRPISKDAISPILERIIKSKESTSKSNSANLKLSNISTTTSRPSKLTSQNPISFTEEKPRSTTLSTPVSPLTTTSRPYRVQSKPLSIDSTTTKGEMPLTNFYHQLLRNSGLRLLQTATHNPVKDNKPNFTRIIPTLAPDLITHPTIYKSTRIANRKIPTGQDVSPIKTAMPTTPVDSTVSQTKSKSILNTGSPSTADVNTKTLTKGRDVATDISTQQTVHQPTDENTFFYTDLRSIMRALGNPIDVSSLSG